MYYSTSLPLLPAYFWFLKTDLACNIISPRTVANNTLEIRKWKWYLVPNISLLLEPNFTMSSHGLQGHKYSVNQAKCIMKHVPMAIGLWLSCYIIYNGPNFITDFFFKEDLFDLDIFTRLSNLRFNVRKTIHDFDLGVGDCWWVCSILLSSTCTAREIGKGMKN